MSMEKLSRALTGLVVVAALAVVVAGCGSGKAAPASPVHTVNVFFDGLGHNDFRQTCAIVKGFPNQSACEQYFVMNTALAGGGTTGHAVAHSEKIVGGTASVDGVDSNGVRYVIVLQRQKDGGWKITSVSAV